MLKHTPSCGLVNECKYMFKRVLLMLKHTTSCCYRIKTVPFLNQMSSMRICMRARVCVVVCLCMCAPGMQPNLGINEVYGTDWELLLGTTKNSWPNNDAYKEFEETVTPWSRYHNHGQSAAFGRTETAVRYWAEMMKVDIK